MRIDPKGELFGYPSLRIRHLMRTLSRWPGGVQFVAEVMQISNAAAKRLVADLVGAGYLQTSTNGRGERDNWQLTLSGSALAMASAAPPLRRATAERRLAEFLQRVRQVNDEPYWLYRVSKVVLFGSMLTENPTVNDVDLAVDLEPKVEDRNAMWELRTARVNEARQRGRQFSNYSDEMRWPKDEIFLFLRAHTRTLNLADYRSQEQLFTEAPHQVIFKEP